MPASLLVKESTPGVGGASACQLRIHQSIWTAAAAKLDVILFTGLTVPRGAICGNPAGNEEIAFFFTQNIWMYSTMISDKMGSAGFGTLCPGRYETR
jgi:hypothetical protein